VAGLALGTLLIGWFGFGRVMAASVSVGWGGFALVCGWQMLSFTILGLAWSQIVPRHGRMLGVFVWGRMVRDAAANCLPLSQIGGFVLGARAVTLHGLSWSIATASTVVDITAEFLAQLVFAAVGLTILIVRVPDSPLGTPVAVGLGLALASGAIFLWLQRRAVPIFTVLGERIARRVMFDKAEKIALLHLELARLSGHTGRLASGVAIHLLGWFVSGIAGWIALRLLGSRIDLPAALAIDGLVQAVLAVSFLVPGNIGVQEAAYIGVGAAFGLPADIALAVSLVRRARDLAAGLPILLAWQFAEMRHIRVVRPS
jgi:glycosyltransferase 2 family protein